MFQVTFLQFDGKCFSSAIQTLNSKAFFRGETGRVNLLDADRFWEAPAEKCSQPFGEQTIHRSSCAGCEPVC